MQVWDGKGPGFDVVGFAVGVVVPVGLVAVRPAVGVTGEVPAVDDRVALPSALFDTEGDGDSEADADTEAFGGFERAPLPVALSRGCAASPVSDEVFAPPAAGGLEVAKGTSMPSSATLRPPAARTKPAARRRVRRRRRRWAAALRSRRLPAPTGPVTSSPASRPGPRPRPCARRRAARPCGAPASSWPCSCPSGVPEPSVRYGSRAMSDGGGTSASSACARSSSTGVPHPGHARAPLRCRRHGWQKSMTRED